MHSPAVSLRLNRGLVILTVLVLLGALLAPEGRWWGMDLGATSQALYVLCVSALVWQVGWQPEYVFPEEWSIAERRGWANVFFGLLILLSFAKFLWHVSHLEIVPDAPWKMVSRQFFWNLGVLMVAAAVVHRCLGARTPGVVELDERDLRIRHAAVRFGDTLLTSVVVAGVVLLAVLPAQRVEWWLAPMIAAHLLIGVLICKSLAENLWLVLSYARERD